MALAESGQELRRHRLGSEAGDTVKSVRGRRMRANANTPKLPAFSSESHWRNNDAEDQTYSSLAANAYHPNGRSQLPW